MKVLPVLIMSGILASPVTASAKPKEFSFWNLAVGTYQVTPANYKAMKTAIEKANAQYGIPKHLLVSLVEGESSFKTRASGVSVLGGPDSQGLMQLKPATAKEACKLPSSELSKIKKNINCGAKYLSQLFGEFKRWDFAIVAYNVGPGTVRRALGNNRSMTTTELLTALPSPAKERGVAYINKILRNWKRYENK